MGTSSWGEEPKWSEKAYSQRAKVKTPARWLAVERARTGLCVTSKAACISLQEGFRHMGYKLATRGTKHLKRVPTQNISACQLVCVVKYTAWSVTSHQNRTKKSQETRLGHSCYPADQSPCVSHFDFPLCVHSA